MSPVHLGNLGVQKNQPEDREGLEEDTLDTMEPQTIVLELYGSRSSAPPTPQRFISMEHGQNEVQPGISLGRTWNKLPENLAQRDRLQRPHRNHQRLESHQEFQTPEGEGKRDTPGKILRQSSVIDFTSSKCEAGLMSSSPQAEIKQTSSTRHTLVLHQIL
ncbi:hypothetical protein O181_117118 [Austropuccinia psidii MF-1]|uniref:Uncharacterized protein n=1 Tax=Austropuccinia psidii MF-1 TaxID=1389203 RepID=A0A9Q3K9P7_9BASI|nr:hypothetical protein [Austropuccinia psidii MF-1]